LELSWRLLNSQKFQKKISNKFYSINFKEHFYRWLHTPVWSLL
jgi:hypothetical protein